MRCIVIYYSQTGNTERVAKAISAGISQKAGDCRVAKIGEADPRRLYEYDLIGIGAPVWGVEPHNVGAFINDMRFVGGKHVFVFCTHGAVPDLFFPSIMRKLRHRGLKVIGLRDWYANCTLLHHVQPYPTYGHPDEIDLKEAKEFGKEMVQRSEKIMRGEKTPALHLPKFPKAAPGEFGDLKVGLDIIKSFPSVVKYHKNKCKYPKCRLCMDNCPVYGIDLSLKTPVIAKPCVNCELCIRLCPTGAIDGDEWAESVAKHGASKLTKYIIMPRLEKAEAEGRFRRLIPVQKLNLNNYGYMLKKKHPYLIMGKGGQ